MTRRQRKPPRQLRAERTRRGLLDAARRVFARGGYAGATVEEIARAGGVSKGAYYFHFASKEEVLLTLVDDWTRSRSRRLAWDGSDTPDVALDGLLEALGPPEATAVWDARLLLEFWSQAERNPKVRRRLTRAYRAWRELLVRGFRRAQEAGAYRSDVALEAAADAALALHDGLIVHTCLGLPASPAPRKRAEAILALLTGSGAPRAARARPARSVRAVG